MKFGMGSNNKRTQKYARVKVQMTYVRIHIDINKYPNSQFIWCLARFARSPTTIITEKAV